MTSPEPLTQREREDDSARSYDVGIEAIRKELEISRKALAEIAEPHSWKSYKLDFDELYGEFLRLQLIAWRALEEIQEARRG